MKVSVEMNHGDVHALLNTYHQGFLRNYEVAKNNAEYSIPSEFFSRLATTMKEGHSVMQRIADEICKDECINANAVNRLVSMDGRWEAMVKEVEGIAESKK